MTVIYTSTGRGGLLANPILVQFRDHVDNLVGGWERVGWEASWWLWLMGEDPYFENENYWGDHWLRDQASVQHVVHARRVLERLEALSDATRLCERCREEEPRSQGASLCSACTTEMLARQIRNLK